MLDSYPCPVRRTPPDLVTWVRQWVFICALTAAGCREDGGSVGAPEHFTPVVVDSPVGPLRLKLGVWPKNMVFRRSDSIMINYQVVNPGPGDHAYHDAAEYYHFRVFAPNGQRLYPRVVSATDGGGSHNEFCYTPVKQGQCIRLILPACPTTHIPLSPSCGRRVGTAAKPSSSFGKQVRTA